MFETSNVLFKSCIDVLTVVLFLVDVLFDFCRVSLKHDGTDGTVKMANLPVPSVCDRRDRLSLLSQTDDC